MQYLIKSILLIFISMWNFKATQNLPYVNFYKLLKQQAILSLNFKLKLIQKIYLISFYCREVKLALD